MAVVTVDAAAEAAARCQAGGGRVVVTNGCFDVLHRGHVEYLCAARALGSLLIAGVNDDASVRRRKGPGRPVSAAADRAVVLAALRPVDHVVIFGQDTACGLVAAIRPDVYVKGGDYAGADLPEADVVRGYGGQVRLLPYADGYSTTVLLAKCGNSAGSGPR